jgi:multidrug resistance efflux pump
MSDPRTPERIGYALRALAADLATARRQVLLLRRENRLLRAKLAALQANAAEPDDPSREERGKNGTRADEARACRRTRVP